MPPPPSAPPWPVALRHLSPPFLIPCRFIPATSRLSPLDRADAERPTRTRMTLGGGMRRPRTLTAESTSPTSPRSWASTARHHRRTRRPVPRRCISKSAAGRAASRLLRRRRHRIRRRRRGQRGVFASGSPEPVAAAGRPASRSWRHPSPRRPPGFSGHPQPAPSAAARGGWSLTWCSVPARQHRASWPAPSYPLRATRPVSVSGSAAAPAPAPALAPATGSWS